MTTVGQSQPPAGELSPARRDTKGLANARSSGPGHVVVGIAGLRQNASAALCLDGSLVACCEQERLTRQRRAGLEPATLPLAAVQAVLARIAGEPAMVDRFATAENDIDLPLGLPTERVDHHRAHAATSFYLSGYDTAAVLVCDRHRGDQISLWTASRDELIRLAWPTEARGLAALYSEATHLFGFPRGGEHHLESLARLDPTADASRFEDLVALRDGRLVVASDWGAVMSSWLAAAGGDLGRRANVAGAFQRHLGSLLLQLARQFRDAVGGTSRLCVGGGLFYNTWFNTRLKQSGIFEDVFVPPNPGNAGTAIGAALLVAGSHGHQPSATPSPFLGPSFDLEEIKRTLDNCKLSAECLSEREVIDRAAAALHAGHLVGWFQGRMEWGPRALGNRSILASPLSPYVLDNLNVYLKHRERHRAYGVSVLEEQAPRFFGGPPTSRFMEFEYSPIDRAQFAPILPPGAATLRVQTVPSVPDDDAATRRFRELHERFAARTGVPVLVNTSFNGFAEPIVCSPRDAIRVFFGTGLDLLVLDRFVISK